ncbi:MAG: VWA domain-containing protein, partial [Acidobacteriota bacterium]
LEVPKRPQRVSELGLPDMLDPEAFITAVDEEIAKEGVEGVDSLLLVPPDNEINFGLWRAEVLVTGSRITRVRFLVDGKEMMSRKRPPFTAEVRLSDLPKEQVVRVEGYDDAGELVAADEVTLNQPRGQLAVRILEPRQGAKSQGLTKTRVQITVPEERNIEVVRFLLGEEEVATRTAPPWEVEVDVPYSVDLSYLTVIAELDDGSKAEAVRFLNSKDFVDEIDVDLIELYTTVTDRRGGIVRGLEKKDFTVFEDGKQQEISKFEVVTDLPLNLGIVLDISGSMQAALGSAQRTAQEFLEALITPKDKAFGIAFNDEPVLLMGRTSDVGAVIDRLNETQAYGGTALHDAVVTGLYYQQGIRGRRALVLLSDGDDTASALDRDQALLYAKRAGVVIYSIGLGISRISAGTRGHLEDLAYETGGRAFFIDEPSELRGVYAQIEEELRSQYLLAYSPGTPISASDEELVFHEIEVEVEGSSLKARTIRGYYR